jgi:tRNA modification GTPase
MTDAPTTFAVLTPPGAAAVATIAVAGPQAWDIVRRSFRRVARPESAKGVASASTPFADSGRANPTLPLAPDAARFWYGQFGAPPGDAVVVSARPAPAGVCVELHCHGGPEVVRMLTAELTRLGATPSGSAEWLHSLGVSPLITAAQLELAHAPTLRTAAILLDQCAGAFGRALDDLDAALSTSDLPGATAVAQKLTTHSALGRRLTRPWRVAVVGAPNVGKSSLVNALAGYQRSVVTEIPGTTRDVVVTASAIDGWPVELIDTAGQRSAGDALEGQGIARGRVAALAADLCLWVVDVTAEPVWPVAGTAKPLLVINKSDLPAQWDVSKIADGVTISARTGAGMGDLCDRIGRRLVPDPPPPGAAVPFTAVLAEKVAVVSAALAAGDIPAARAALTSFGHPMQSAPSR